MKGLTDTSALSGGLEIKTSGSEPWKVCSPSPWCARGILQDERQEWLPLVVSHNSHTGYTWQTPWHIRGSKAVKRAAEDKRWRARRWKEKKARRSTCGKLINEQVRGTTAWTQRKLWERQADQWLSPRGRLHRIHTMRDRNMAAAHFFSPNYQTPYWLSSGREEVIWFLSPFGKLIHFTKVTW